MKNFFYTAILTLLVSGLQAQIKIGNNPTTINAGSVLEVESTNKGLLYPRISLTATTAWGLAGTAAAGMSVYNTNTGITGNATYPALGAGMYYFDGTGWVAVNAKATEPWYNVATGTAATSNTQNIYQLGNVGIGTTQSTFKLNVLGVAQFGQTLAGVGMRMQTSGIYANITGINHDNNAFNGLSFTTGASPTMYLPTSGDVGIGTSTPGAKLEVVTAATGVNAVIARSTGASSNGIYSEATGGGGNAGYFNATGTSNGLASYAITGIGSYGQSTNSYGVYGRTLSVGVAGVIGYSGNNVIYGMLGFNNQYSLYGNGDITISGTLAKGAGTFKIDHPQDPANKYLVHSFVESPDMMNVYNGNIVTDADGNATVKLPDYFLSLNKEFRYQLTAIGTFAQAIVAEEVNKTNEFKIKTDKPNVKISWQVTGIRQDAYANAHRIKDVVEKNSDEKGKYLHPELYNQPAGKGVFYKEPQAPLEVKKGN
jgi:hypothetical protein